MKIKFIVIGNTAQKFVEDGMEEYSKRIKNFIPFDFIVVKDIKNAKNMSKEELKKREGEDLLKIVESGDKLILLDDKGKKYNSLQFAESIQNKMNASIKNLTFVVGGAFGFSDEVYQRADEQLSLSAMTFSHQIIRVIFLEQLYRAFTILHNLPYHHE